MAAIAATLCLASSNAWATTGDNGAATAAAIEAPAAAPHNTSFNVGQLYVGGHVGFSLPTAIGREKDQISFKDVAKTGFVIFADGMYQMNQQVGVGGEVGFRTYPYNDERTWSNLTRYGAFEASYTAIDFGLNGRLFLTRTAVRPFLGIHAGGEVAMNKVDFVPNAKYASLAKPTVYESNSLSACFGFMTGAYFKVGRRTLASVQIRLSLVPQLKDEDIVVTNEYQEIQTTKQNPHGNQNNLSVTVGLHIGTQKNNKR